MDELLDGVVVDPGDTLELPRNLLTEILPQMTDISEIQVTLAAARLASEAGALDAPVNEIQLVRDPAVRP